MALQNVSGYISSRESVSALQCYLLSPSTSSSASVLTSSYSSAYDFGSFENDVASTIDTSLSFLGVVNINTAQSFYNSVKQDDFSLSFIYATKYDYPTTVYTLPGINTSAFLTTTG